MIKIIKIIYRFFKRILLPFILFFQKFCCILYRISSFKLEKGARPSRFIMYEHMKSMAEARSPDAKVLTISKSEQLAEFLGFKRSQIKDVAFPEYNITNLPFESNHFDAIVVDQVLEHVVEGPFLAMQESFRVVKSGGLVVHATVFNYPIHLYPNDYWRFTPKGLEALVKPYGKVIDSGGWGSRWIPLFWMMGLRSEPMPVAKWHPANILLNRNNIENPMVVWVIAQKN